MKILSLLFLLLIPFSTLGNTSQMQHCVVHVEPQNPVPTSTTCFRTFAESIGFATGGSVTVTAANSPDEVHRLIERGQRTGSRNRDNVLAILYNNTNFDASGGTFSITSALYTCSTHWFYGDLTGSYANDWVASAKRFGDCPNVVLFDLTPGLGFPVPKINCKAAGCSNLFALNDATSYYRINPPDE